MGNGKPSIESRRFDDEMQRWPLELDRGRHVLGVNGAARRGLGRGRKLAVGGAK